MQTAIFELTKVIAGKVDLTHGIQHAETVMHNAQKALEYDSAPNDDQKLAILLAALLHDADDHKYFPESKDLDNARLVLDKLRVTQEIKTLVLKMIRLVSCSTNGNSVESVEHEWMLYPRYADRLEALGEIGLLRCWMYTKHVDRPLFIKETPRPRSKEELYKIASKERFDNYVNSGGKGSTTFIEHFYDKLLHIGDLGNNPYFIKESKKRMQTMEDFILEFSRTGQVDEVYLQQLADKYF